MAAAALQPSARLLALLSLLQLRREWTGEELAVRLEVGPRTIRRDIDKLRALGYPVHAVRGGVAQRCGRLGRGGRGDGGGSAERVDLPSQPVRQHLLEFGQGPDRTLHGRAQRL